MRSTQAYLRKLARMRASRGAKDVETGSYVLCPCSFALGLSQRALKVYTRPSKKKPGKCSVFASCDRCGVVMHFNGIRPSSHLALQISERELRLIMRGFEGMRTALRDRRSQP